MKVLASPSRFLQVLGIGFGACASSNKHYRSAVLVVQLSVEQFVNPLLLVAF